MTKAIKAKSTSKPVATEPATMFNAKMREGETRGKMLARVALDPLVRHASVASTFAKQTFSDGLPSSIMETAAALEESIAKAASGDTALASRVLALQAVSLDAMFTELARRSSMKMGEYPHAMERYMRLALKAQSACRSTLEALARLHQPREQTVRHVHVNDGGQAVVADQFHHHAGGMK